MAHDERLRVEVVYCPAPGQADSRSLSLPAGATVEAALQASGVLTRHAIDLSFMKVGVWSRVKTLSTPLRDQDRVEIYRPLTVDPKEARRLRYQKHGRKPGRNRNARQDEAAVARPVPGGAEGSAAV